MPGEAGRLLGCFGGGGPSSDSMRVSLRNRKKKRKKKHHLRHMWGVIQGGA
jgi:hypothetical protein